MSRKMKTVLYKGTKINRERGRGEPHIILKTNAISAREGRLGRGLNLSWRGQKILLQMVSNVGWIQNPKKSIVWVKTWANFQYL